MDESKNKYITDRVDDQIKYFDSNAIKNQKNYKQLKSIAITCNVLTTLTIAFVFVVPEAFKIYVGVIALILSTIVLATYQWEEFENYGSKWEKFRLVAEQLKSEKCMFENNAGRYSSEDDSTNKILLVESVEKVIRGTDISYFSFMVEPGKRIEKRLAGIGNEYE